MVINGKLLLALLVAVSACAGEDPQRSAADTSASTTVAAGTAGSAGQDLYQRCVSCHQANGEGLSGSFPPLAASEYATAANASVPIQIVIRGMQGPVTVKGVQYNGVMPPYGLGIEMSDDEVAAVLTHVRSSWGNSAPAITPQEVAAVRAQAAGKPAVTAEELAPLL